jgi:predicted dehydrogenase
MARSWQDVSVLIIGCGSIGKRHARVLAGLGATDIRVCDPSAEQRRTLVEEVPSARTYDSFEAGLNDGPHSVLICTPPAMHIPMARKAIEAGCHVLTEKPLSDSTDGVDDLIAMAERHRKKVMVALCFRYHDGLVRAKQYLDSGRIGRLASVRALMGEHLPDVRPDYRTLFSAKVGGAFDLMHDIDLALWYAGQPVRSVHAVYGNYSDIGIEAPDLVEILVDFQDRCTATVHLDFFQRPRRRQMELIGTKGVVTVEFARWDHCTVSVYEAAKAQWEVEELATDRDDMLRAEDREFLEAVAEDKPIRSTIAEGCRSLEVVLAAQRGRP